MVVSGPPQSPRTGLALTDLQQSTSTVAVEASNLGGGTYSIGGGVISGLAVSGHGGSSNWSTRGVGGIGAGLSCSANSASAGLFGGSVGVKLGGGLGLHSAGPSFQGSFGGFPSSSGAGTGLFGASSEYGLFKK